MTSLDRIQAELKTGNEKLIINEKECEFSLLDFWKWSVSDILSNATRGRFAEFIVATATNIDIKQVREEWGAFDLETADGIKIEVKSAAYLQSWFQKKLSDISFSTKPSLQWDSLTNKQGAEKMRSANVYVFCLLKHTDKATVNPLNMEQWEFYVLATKELDDYKRSQFSITLKSLQTLTKSVNYQELNNEVIFKNKLNIK